MTRHKALRFGLIRCRFAEISTGNFGIFGNRGEVVSLKNASRNRKPPKQRFPHPFTRKVSRSDDTSENRFSSLRWCSWIGNIFIQWRTSANAVYLFPIFRQSPTPPSRRRLFHYLEIENETRRLLEVRFPLRFQCWIFTFVHERNQGMCRKRYNTSSKPATNTDCDNAMRMQHETSKGKLQHREIRKISLYSVNFCGHALWVPTSLHFTLKDATMKLCIIRNTDPYTRSEGKFPDSVFGQWKELFLLLGMTTTMRKVSRLCASESTPAWHFLPLPWIIALQCHIKQNKIDFIIVSKSCFSHRRSEACQIFIQLGYCFFDRHERKNVSTEVWKVD